MNKKGCLIAAVVVLVLAAVGIGGCVFFTAKFGIQMGLAGAAFAIEMEIAEFQRQNPEAQVPPTNEAWAEALQGFSGSGSDISAFLQGGKIVDIFQNEMGIEQAEDGTIRVISPGKDGVLGTKDDVTSDMFNKLKDKFE